MEQFFFPNASFSVSVSVSTRPQVSVPSSALSSGITSPNMSPAPPTPSPVALTSLETSTVTTRNPQRPTKRVRNSNFIKTKKLKSSIFMKITA